MQLAFICAGRRVSSDVNGEVNAFLVGMRSRGVGDVAEGCGLRLLLVDHRCVGDRRARAEDDRAGGCGEANELAA